MKLYELKSDAAFNGGDFFSVFDNEQKTLGSDLLNSEVFQLRPGETLKLERPIQPNARYIAVVAAFRDLEHSQWRATLAIPPKKKIKRIAVQLDANKIMISGEQKCLLWCGSVPESFQVSRPHELQNRVQTKRTAGIQLAPHNHHERRDGLE
jgi:type VI secretion system protein VasD